MGGRIHALRPTGVPSALAATVWSLPARPVPLQRLHSSHTEAVRMTRESCARPLWCGCQTRDAIFLRAKH